MTEKMLKIKDADTGESTLDVVDIPEGFSFQIGGKVYVDTLADADSYVSTIVSPVEALRLITFLCECMGLEDLSGGRLQTVAVTNIPPQENRCQEKHPHAGQCIRGKGHKAVLHAAENGKVW